MKNKSSKINTLLVIDDSRGIKYKIKYLLMLLRNSGQNIYVLCRDKKPFLNLENEKIKFISATSELPITLKKTNNIEKILSKVDIKHFINYINLNNGKYSLAEVEGSQPFFELISKPTIPTLEYTYCLIKKLVMKLRINNFIILNGFSVMGFASSLLSSEYSIQSIYWENGLLPNSLIIDEVGVNYFSKLSKDFLKKRSRNKNKLIKENLENKLKDVISSKKHILVCLQLDLDTNIIFNSQFVNTYHFLEVVIKTILPSCKGEMNLRIHPKTRNSKPIIDWIRSNKNKNLKINNLKNSIEDSIKSSDLIITINSTVAIESILENKDVLIFGETAYSNIFEDFYLNKNDFKVKYNFYQSNKDLSLRKIIIDNIVNKSLFIDKNEIENNINKIKKVMNNDNHNFLMKKHQYPIKLPYKLINIRSNPGLMRFIYLRIEKKIKIIFKAFKIFFKK